MSQRWSDEARAKFRSPEYRAWTMMKTRCYNTNHHKYPRYGGRGIKVCERWKSSFESFLEDMGSRPGKGYSIDREDNDGDYTPKNCRWATASQQASNKGTTRWIEVGGEQRTLQDWANRLGSDPQTISDRLARGWEPVDAVSTLPRSQAQGDVTLTLDGRSQRLFEWAEETGLSSATISKRLKRGWSIDRALTTPSGG